MKKKTVFLCVHIKIGAILTDQQKIGEEEEDTKVKVSSNSIDRQKLTWK